MMVEHTPPPWTARDNGNFWEIGSENGLVADLVESTSMFDRKDYGEVNAKFIVRAVNAHDDLVAALVEARLALCASNGSEEAIRVIDDALAKAEGTR